MAAHMGMFKAGQMTASDHAQQRSQRFPLPGGGRPQMESRRSSAGMCHQRQSSFDPMRREWGDDAIRRGLHGIEDGQHHAHGGDLGNRSQAELGQLGDELCGVTTPPMAGTPSAAAV